MASQVWRQVLNVKDPQLSHLVAKLPDTVLGARALSTTKKYIKAYNHWKLWMEEFGGGVALPVSLPWFMIYLQHVGDKTGSKAAVEEAINGVSWAQRLAGEQPVSQNEIVKMVGQGLQRSLAKPKQKKEPVTGVMLRELVESLGSPPSLSEARLASICLLSFVAFLRFDEVARLRCCDIKFAQEKMEVCIISSKTDQWRQGSVILVARTGKVSCPVAMLESYFKLGKIDGSSQERLFRAVSRSKSGERLRASGSLSYCRVRELVLAKFAELGYDAGRIGLHSFRAGGATAAANNPALPERLFKRHGRWLSERAKDGYIKESEGNRLRVSKSLGI